jgi:translation elongation factor P/translation initiation factor 5A|tara:strand:+ start:1389 stop:1580 length:192 start_codon:yes stop_codon:yes gene_type:complete
MTTKKERESLKKPGMIMDIMFGPLRRGKKVTSKGEEAAVYDVEKNKSNKYGAVNRHLINKLRG